MFNFYVMQCGAKKRKTESDVSIAGFPRLVIDKIMRMLPGRDVARLAQTCKRMSTMAKRKQLWQFLVERDFPGFELKLFASWRELYIYSRISIDKLESTIFTTNNIFFHNLYCAFKCPRLIMYGLYMKTPINLGCILDTIRFAGKRKMVREVNCLTKMIVVHKGSPEYTVARAMIRRIMRLVSLKNHTNVMKTIIRNVFFMDWGCKSEVDEFLAHMVFNGNVAIIKELVKTHKLPKEAVYKKMSELTTRVHPDIHKMVVDWPSHIEIE